MAGDTRLAKAGQLKMAVSRLLAIASQLQWAGYSRLPTNGWLQMSVWLKPVGLSWPGWLELAGLAGLLQPADSSRL